VGYRERHVAAGRPIVCQPAQATPACRTVSTPWRQLHGHRPFVYLQNAAITGKYREGAHPWRRILPPPYLLAPRASGAVPREVGILAQHNVVCGSTAAAEHSSSRVLALSAVQAGSRGHSAQWRGCTWLCPQHGRLDDRFKGV
jgi:hypothetical protein